MVQRSFWPRAVQPPALRRSIASLSPAVVARTGAAVAVVAGTVMATIYAFSRLNDGMMHNDLGNDEGYFVWCGWSILKGLVPYRDFMEFKPPFAFLTHALALKLFGLQDLQFRRFFFYFPLASVVAAQLALVSRGADKLCALAVALALVHVWVSPHLHDTALTDTESIGLAYYFLGTACLLARTPLRPLALAMGGALLACSVLSKEPFLPEVFFTWIGCCFTSERTRDISIASLRSKGFRDEALFYAKYTLLGVAVVAAGLIVYMAPTGALKAYLAIASRYSTVYRDPAQSYCAVGGAFEPTTPMNDVVRFWSRARHEFANLQTLGVLVPFGVAFLAFTARRSPVLFVAATFAAASALYGVNISNCPWIHYYNIAIGGIFFCAFVGVDSMTAHLRAADPRTRAFIRFAMLGATLAAVWPSIDAERDAYGNRGFPGHFAEAVPGEFEMVREHSQPGDYIVTTGNPDLYFETDRLNGVRESTLIDPMLGFYVGDTDEEKLRSVYDEMVKHRPKVVVLDPQFASQKERHRKALFDPYLQAFHYREIRPHIFVGPN
jgi:hypothetical protein